MSLTEKQRVVTNLNDRQKCLEVFKDVITLYNCNRNNVADHHHHILETSVRDSWIGMNTYICVYIQSCC